MMVDQSFALSVRKYELEPDVTPRAKSAYYFGTLMAVAPVWYVSTFAGSVIGRAIPPVFSLEFAVPVCFTDRASCFAQEQPLECNACPSK